MHPLRLVEMQLTAAAAADRAEVATGSARHERNSIRFNMLNPKTGNRIKMVTQDAETGEPLSRGETVKGYEFSKDHYRIVTVEETRLRAMFDAKIQGQPLSQDAPPPVSSNVIDLMAALKKSLGEPPKPVEAVAPPTQVAGKRAQKAAETHAAQAARAEAADRGREEGEAGSRARSPGSRAREPHPPPRLTLS